jgi:hypothetical protein
MTTRQRSTSSSADPPVPGEVVLGVDTHGEVQAGLRQERPDGSSTDNRRLPVAP